MAIAHPQKPERPQVAHPQAPTIEPAAELRQPKPNEKVAVVVGGALYPRKNEKRPFEPAKDPYGDYAATLKDHLLKSGKVDRVIVLNFTSGEIRSFWDGGPAKGDLQTPTRDALRPANYRYRGKKKAGGAEVLTLKRGQVPGTSRLYYTGADELATAKPSGKAEDEVPYKEWFDARGNRFAKENSLSVTDVYKAVATAGPGRVAHLHFFGHAWREGPIIVNTPGGEDKKEYDKDPRPRDFANWDVEQKLGKAWLAKFSDAFTSEPLLMIWGCESNDDAKTYIVQARDKLKRGQDATAELGKLRDFVKANYAQRLATAAKRDVVSALPGTYAVHEGQEPKNETPETIAQYDSKVNQKYFKPKLMHVNIALCGHMLTFYADQTKKGALNTPIAKGGLNDGHPTHGRGYGIYKK